MAVHHCDPGVGLGEQGVDEGHSRGTSANHQIISIDFHAHFYFPSNNFVVHSLHVRAFGSYCPR